jgi:hypothetical protein
MKHTVMGIYEGDDFASYENVLPIKSEELAVLMGWKDQEDYVYDYQLTKDQTNSHCNRPARFRFHPISFFF